MTSIDYRDYDVSHAGDVKRMINEAFDIHRYARAPRLLDSALEVYLAERLAASTYAQVAVREGRAVGVLMGQVSGQAWLPGRIRNRLRMWAHMGRIALTGFGERKTLGQYFAFGPAYRRLRREATVPPTDELTLFAVDAGTRGSGVGSAMYRDFLDHLRACGRRDFYLYTDTWCTYEFYERQGMRRAAEETMTLRFGSDTEELGIYLYAGAAD